MNTQTVALPGLAERPVVLSVPEVSGIPALMKVDRALRLAQLEKPLLDWLGLANALSKAGFQVLGGLDAEKAPTTDRENELWLYRNWDENRSGAFSFLVAYPEDSGNELAGRTGLATNRPDLYVAGLFGRQLRIVIVLDTGEMVMPDDLVWNEPGEMVPAGAVIVPAEQFPDAVMHEHACRLLQENGFEVRDV